MSMTKGEMQGRLEPFDEQIKIYVAIPGYGVVSVLRSRYEWFGGEGSVVLDIELPPLAKHPS
jgi:hypothetical protein